MAGATPIVGLPHPLPAHYTKMLGEIRKIEQQYQGRPKELVDALNKFIIDNHISDKPISYTSQAPEYAGWNVACGHMWVDVKNPPGQPSDQPKENPTKGGSRDPNSGHKERMACCRAILGALQGAGIANIAVQEAPIYRGDEFYRGGDPAFRPVAHDKEKGNIRVAMVGSNPTAISQVNPQDPHAQKYAQMQAHIQQLKQRYGIQDYEFQAMTAAHDPGKCVVNIHLDYAPKGVSDPAMIAQHQEARKNFLNDLVKLSPDIIVIGDANIIRAHEKGLAQAACFGCAGPTEDVIARQGVQSEFKPSHDARTIRGSLPSAPQPTVEAEQKERLGGLLHAVAESTLNFGDVGKRVAEVEKQVADERKAKLEAEKQAKETVLERRKTELESLIRQHTTAIKTGSLGDQQGKYVAEVKKMQAELKQVDAQIAQKQAVGQAGPSASDSDLDIRMSDLIQAAKSPAPALPKKEPKLRGNPHQKYNHAVAPSANPADIQKFAKLADAAAEARMVCKGNGKPPMAQFRFDDLAKAKAFWANAQLGFGVGQIEPLDRRQPPDYIVRLNQHQYQLLKSTGANLPDFQSLPSPPLSKQQQQQFQEQQLLQDYAAKKGRSGPGT